MCEPNTISSTVDPASRRRRGPSEYLSLLSLTQGRTPARQPRTSAADKTFVVPEGSRIIGGLIIPPFFSLSRNNTASREAAAAASSRAQLPPRSFLGALIDRFAPSRPAVDVVHIASGGLDDVAKKTQDSLNERHRTKPFLDNYLIDCLKKNSSVFTAGEKLKMKMVEEALMREKRKEDAERVETQHQGDGTGRSPRGGQAVKEKMVKGDQKRETKDVKKAASPERDNTSSTLGSELSREHPLFGRSFREQIRTHALSDTELSVSPTSVSPRSCADANMAGDARRKRDHHRRPPSSESTSSEESRTHVRQVERGDTDIEVQQSTFRDNREFRQVDKKKMIQLNKTIFMENMRTLKKLREEKTMDDLEERLCLKKESKSPRKFNKNKELEMPMESGLVKYQEHNNNEKHVSRESESKKTTAESKEKPIVNQKKKGPVNDSGNLPERKKDNAHARLNHSPATAKKSADGDNKNQKTDRRKNSKKIEKKTSDDEGTTIEVVYRNKNFLNIKKESVSPKLQEHVPVRTIHNAEQDKTKKYPSSQHNQKNINTKYSDSVNIPLRNCRREDDVKKNCIGISETLKNKLQEISDNESSSLVWNTSYVESYAYGATEGVQCEAMKVGMKELPVLEYETSRMAYEGKSMDVAERDFPRERARVCKHKRQVAETDCRSPRFRMLKNTMEYNLNPVTFEKETLESDNDFPKQSAPRVKLTREVGERDRKSPRVSNSKKPMEDTVKPLILAEQTQESRKDFPNKSVQVRKPTRDVIESGPKSPRVHYLKKSIEDILKPSTLAGETLESPRRIEKPRQSKRAYEKNVTEGISNLLEFERENNRQKSKNTKENPNHIEANKESCLRIRDGGSDKQTNIQMTTEFSESELTTDYSHGVTPVIGYAIPRKKKKKERSWMYSSENSTTSDSFLILCDGRTSRIGCVHNRFKVKHSVQSGSTSSSSTNSEVDAVENQTRNDRERKVSTGRNRRDDVNMEERDFRQSRLKPQTENETKLKPITHNQEDKNYKEIMEAEENDNVKDDVDYYFNGFPVPDAIKQLFQYKEFNKILKHSKDYHGLSTERKPVTKKHAALKSRKSQLRLMRKCSSYKHSRHSKDVTQGSFEKRIRRKEQDLVDETECVTKEVSFRNYDDIPHHTGTSRSVMRVETVKKVDVSPVSAPEKAEDETKQELLGILKWVHEKTEKLGRVRRVMEVIEEKTDLDEMEKTHLLADMMVAVDRQYNDECEAQTQAAQGKHALCLYASEKAGQDTAGTYSKNTRRTGPQVALDVLSPRTGKEAPGDLLNETTQGKDVTKNMYVSQKQSIKPKISSANDSPSNIDGEASNKRKDNKSSRSERTGTHGDTKHVLGAFHENVNTNEVIVSRASVHVHDAEEQDSKHKTTETVMDKNKNRGTDMRSKQMEEHMARVVAEYLNKKKQYENLKEDNEDQPSDGSTIREGNRINLCSRGSKLRDQGKSATIHKPQARVEKCEKFLQTMVKDSCCIEDITGMRKDVDDILNQWTNVQQVQLHAKDIVDPNTENKVLTNCESSTPVGDKEPKKEASRNVANQHLKYEDAKSKCTFKPEEENFQNIMSLSHKNVKPLEFVANTSDESSNITYQSKTGITEQYYHRNKQNETRTQKMIASPKDNLMSSKICSIPNTHHKEERVEHSIPYDSNCYPQSPLQPTETQYGTNKENISRNSSYNSNIMSIHNMQKNVGHSDDSSINNVSTNDCIANESARAAVTVKTNVAKKNEETVLEVQRTSKEVCDKEGDRQDVVELITHESARTASYTDLTNVVSHIDSPDKALQEIFKKMDDVIINRFLTLASMKGITIVVTPKLVLNEENQDKGRSKECQDKNSSKEVKTEECVMCTEIFDSDRKMHNSVAIDEHKEILSLPKGNQTKPETSSDSPVESTVNNQVSNENKCGSAQIQSVSNQQQHEPTHSGVTKCERSLLEPAVSSSFNKRDVYYISRTFCKSTGTIRKEKNLQMRLRRGRTTRTRIRSWRGSGTITQKHLEPMIPAEQAPCADQQVMESATKATDFEPNFMPEELRLLEEITFINVRDDKLKSRNECFDELLHCTLKRERQVSPSSHEDIHAAMSGEHCEKSDAKQMEMPVDSFLEKVRQSLDDDELRMLEESSRTTSVVPSSSNEIKFLYRPEPCRPSDTTISTTTSHIRTIEDVISNADNEDRRLSICECFGVTNINDLIDSLGARDQDHRKPKGRVSGIKSGPVNTVKGEAPLRSASDDTITPEIINPANRTSLPPPGPIRKPSRQHRRYQDKHINEWMRGGAKFNHHEETPTDESVEMTKAVTLREEKTGRVDSEHRRHAISGVPLSEFVRNYALKSGIVLDPPAGYNRIDDDDVGDTSSPRDGGATSGGDCVNVKIALSSSVRTDILIQVPPDVTSSTQHGTGCSSGAQIVHVDSQEIVLASVTPEVTAAWSEREEREFERALKKHRPKPKVWNKISRCVGRSKRECVLHFLDIWRKLNSADE